MTHAQFRSAVLESLEIEPSPESEQRLVSSTGASAALRGHGADERLEVRDAKNRLVFELDPKTGKTVVFTHGDLELKATGNVGISAGGEVSIQSKTTRFESEQLRAKVHDVKVVMGRLETVTDRIFEQARSVFRTVADLHQLRAGRSRTVVEDAWDVKAGHAILEAEEEVKVDGKAIHLG